MFGLSRRERLLTDLQSVIDDWMPRRSGGVGEWMRRSMPNGSGWSGHSRGGSRLFGRSSLHASDVADSLSAQFKDQLAAVQRAGASLADAGASTARWATKPSRIRILAVVAGLGLLAFLAGRKS